MSVWQSELSLPPFLHGDGAPTNFSAGAQASKLFASAGANNDLTFTSVATGLAANAYSVAIVQGVGLNVPLGVAVAGPPFSAVITLPTDGAGAAVAKTATQVKAAWDAVAAAVAVATVAVEGTGGGNVAVHAADTLAGGTDDVGTGLGVATKSCLYIDETTPKMYINKGTPAAPSWGIFTSA